MEKEEKTLKQKVATILKKAAEEEQAKIDSGEIVIEKRKYRFLQF